ncbi:hypothetical protein NUW58_g4418 [Xylaria curta]|uniref:Uncharacterized protein n=1 Tax=Xylaria curta TaxID=42375 RepID=A0ACC1P846_9PEZI|nr:hypothetical protein NUW58_g4418 [Xylaria curta]
MAQNSLAAQSRPLHFIKPPCFQRFNGFARLPYDIRYMIWRDVIYTPGIHFLRLVKNPYYTPAEYMSEQYAFASVLVIPGPSHAASRENRVEATLDAEGIAIVEAHPQLFSATLKPVIDLACADNSYYVTKNKTLAQLRESCDEAGSLIKKLLAQPGNLNLYGGQLVSLERSSDIVCIEYPNMTHCRSLGTWADHLDLGQLAKIRRLAIRYHHEWDNGLLCDECGRNKSCAKGHSYPQHVYEFAALFKNLEAFYFIDYLTLRQPLKSPRPPQTPGNLHALLNLSPILDAEHDVRFQPTPDMLREWWW